jgi:diguanylate cyclase (GGDEF)-like protein
VRERRTGPPLWLAPVLGGIGLGLSATAIVVEIGQGARFVHLVVLFAMTGLVLVLSLTLFAMQQGWRSTTAQVHNLEQQLAVQEHALSEAGTRDALTGLPNRVAFYEILELEFEQVARSGQALACVLIDIDHFRQINDRYGHHFGDTVLSRFTRMLVRLLRGEDRVCRYGGDEFMLLLLETDGRQALRVAERIRSHLKREVFSDGNVATAVTASFAVVAVPAEGMTRPNQVIEHIEAALAEAKRGGRDRIAIDPAALAGPTGSGGPSNTTLMEPRPERRQGDRQELRDA